MSRATERIELTVGSDATSPRIVRRAFGEHFAAVPHLADLLLCLTEVVTNAVLHAAPPINVLGYDRRGVIRVEVTDGSTDLPVRRDGEPSSPTGRGLLLLDALTSVWGVEMTANGKVVWFEMIGSAA